VLETPANHSGEEEEGYYSNDDEELWGCAHTKYDNIQSFNNRSNCKRTASHTTTIMRNSLESLSADKQKNTDSQS